MQAWDGTEDANELIPVECQDLLEGGLRTLPGTDHVRPFVLKHARQQAAILGRLQEQGLLQASTLPLTIPVHLSCSDEGRTKEHWVASVTLRASLRMGNLILTKHLDTATVQDTNCTSFLELGAGKAYLACTLAEAFPVRYLVLVDSHSFKLQGDRCFAHTRF